MILIADAGSTKIDWRLVRDGQPARPFTTLGYNPFFSDGAVLKTIIEAALLPSVTASQVSEIHYYGAGCASERRCNEVRTVLSELFPRAKIQVESDMLGATRALFGHAPGIAAIIGTGSNTCFFDGMKITESFPSMGYILGDEGSGAYLGAEFIKAYLRHELPEDLHQKFSMENAPALEHVLESVYSMDAPNRFLASFTKFIGRNLDHPALHQLVHRSFTQFFDRHICRYKNYQSHQVRCVGSVAFHFQRILKEVALEKGAPIDRVLEFPIEELVRFHSRGDSPARGGA